MPFNPAVKPPQLAPSTAVMATGEVSAVLTINAGKMPIHAELRGYFWEVLKPTSGQRSTRQRRIELCCAGEVLPVMK